MKELRVECPADRDGSHQKHVSYVRVSHEIQFTTSQGERGKITQPVPAIRCDHPSCRTHYPAEESEVLVIKANRLIQDVTGVPFGSIFDQIKKQEEKV